VLRDLIQVQRVAVSSLKQIFRQVAQSGIVTAAHRINSGAWEDVSGAEDFYLIDTESPAKARELLGRMLTDRIPKRFGFHPVLDVQVLSPIYKGDAGIESLNRYLQEVLNPHASDCAFGTRIFREGDKVMQLENNYDKEVFNGDQGIIEAIDSSSGQVAVRFDERVIQYTRAESDELTLCYAASVHKVQGSEFPCVILLLFQAHHLMLSAAIWYTPRSPEARNW
jgi:exodeoxyribonuclease V alpha subunit